MTSETEGEYPSIRKALKDDDKVANIYCGLKWLLWQVGYVSLGVAAVVIGVPFAIMAIAALLVHEGLGRIGDYLSAKFGDRYDNTVEKVSTTAKETGQKAQKTPVTRRFYNECPVSLKIRPKWWKKIVDKLDGL